MRYYGNLPTQPVIDYAAARRRMTFQYPEPIEMSVPVLFGMTRNEAREWYRACQTGHITFYQADRLAAKIGVHPTQIWGDAWWEASHERELHAKPHLYDVEAQRRYAESNARARARHRQRQQARRAS